jgi:hypothetical protein
VAYFDVGLALKNGKVVNVVMDIYQVPSFNSGWTGGLSAWDTGPPLCAWVGGALRLRRQMAGPAHQPARVLCGGKLRLLVR